MSGAVFMSPCRRTRFLVDSTCVRLARWLRFLGFDAVLDKSQSSARLIIRASREGRVLLSRKRDLPTSAQAEVVSLHSDLLSAQLGQVLKRFGLTQGFLPRCTLCNGELRIVSRAGADARVPELVFRTRGEFAYCGHCDKYYWQGTHWDRILETSSRLAKRGSEE